MTATTAIAARAAARRTVARRAAGRCAGARGASRRWCCGCSGAGPLDALARETGQPAGTISAWREAFVEAGQEGLKSRPRSFEERQLADAQRKIGELALDSDILRGLLKEMGRHPQSPRR